MTRRPRARWAAAILATILSAPLALSGVASAQVAGGAGVTAEQRAVVTHDHSGPITSAVSAVDADTAQLQGDQASLYAARSELGAHEQARTEAEQRLGADRGRLAEAVRALEADSTHLAIDRNQLRSLAIASYAGAFSTSDAISLQSIGGGQPRYLEIGEVEAVEGAVNGNLHDDLSAFASDTRTRNELDQVVSTDTNQLATAEQTVAHDQDVIASAAVTIASDQQRLSSAGADLSAARASLAAALQALDGPPTPDGQLSLIGGPALSASELVAWYDYQGFVDLTPAPIQALAQWYIDYGRSEGVRGDVAFAQAVLETGGFSSPDAADLNNYAGIGHCDTCSQGWAFPSPAGGVLGQIQLLRIFASNSPAPAGSPPPVLPSLVPAQEMSAGCCASVPSLTGVWATDPTYGTQILAIYQQMLDFALSGAGGST